MKVPNTAIDRRRSPVAATSASAQSPVPQASAPRVPTPRASPGLPTGAHTCGLPLTLTAPRPATPDLVRQVGTCVAPPDMPEAFALTCAAHDERKAAWAEDLEGASEKNALARRLVASVEALHGKSGQTVRMIGVLDRLLVDPRVSQLLDAESAPAEHAANEALPPRLAVRAAAPWLLASEVYAPSAFYLTQGRPSNAARRNFAERPQRAAAFVAEFALAGREVQQLLRQFHADAPVARPVGAQLLDVSERIAAMLTDRPQRRGMAPERASSIVAGLGTQGIVAGELAAAASELVRSGAFAPLVREAERG